MLNVGDLVKIINETCIADDIGRRELYPIGTICMVMEVDEDQDSFYYRVVKVEESEYSGEYDGYWYKENELEKGRLEWIKEESYENGMDC